MENLKKKLKTVQETPDVPNQSSTDADTAERLVDKSRLSSSLLDDRSETNVVDEQHHHYHHESLDVERLENSSSSKLLLNNLNKDDLNEYCLLEIFSHLSMDDMMQVKRVCKKWYHVSQRWFKRVQTLDYHSQEHHENARVELYENHYEREIYEKDEKYGFNDIITILHLYGHHIKYFRAFLTMADTSPIEEREKLLFQWVPNLCENIVDVQIDGYAFHTSSPFEVMATHWKNLEKLDIRCLHQYDDENFRELLRNNKQLKYFTLSFNQFDDDYLMSDKFFTSLPTTIEEIIIKNMSINNTEQLNHFISASKNFTSLQTLELSEFDCLTDAVAAAIGDIKSLIHLSVKFVGRYESRRTIDSIANLKGLKSLNLGYNDELDEDKLINIVESCIQLEAIFIWGRFVLTDRGIGAIAKLKKLKCLFIDMEYITIGSIIKLCGSLEIVGCLCSTINNSDAIKLLQKGLKLRFARFHSCRNLTKDILQAANEIADERKNILCIQASNLDDEDIDKPYFKYYRDYSYIPPELFPNDLRIYIEKILG